MIKNFIIGFTLGYLVVGIFMITAMTNKHNMELYYMEDSND